MEIYSNNGLHCFHTRNYVAIWLYELVWWGNHLSTEVMSLLTLLILMVALDKFWDNDNNRWRIPCSVKLWSSDCIFLHFVGRRWMWKGELECLFTLHSYFKGECQRVVSCHVSAAKKICTYISDSINRADLLFTRRPKKGSRWNSFEIVKVNGNKLQKNCMCCTLSSSPSFCRF